MIHDYESTISALIQGIAAVVAAVLALFGVLITILAYQTWKMKLRMDTLESSFDTSIALLNAVGVWITNGAIPHLMPRIPPSLIDHVTTWPTITDPHPLQDNK